MVWILYIQNNNKLNLAAFQYGTPISIDVTWKQFNLVEIFVRNDPALISRIYYCSNQSFMNLHKHNTFKRIKSYNIFLNNVIAAYMYKLNF